MSLLTIVKSLITKKPPTCTAVIAAAGLSTRCKGEDKLLFAINGKPVLAYTIEAFERSKLIKEIIIVAHEEKIGAISRICIKYGLKKVSLIMKGGPTRLESVINGVFAASRKSQLIAIHDGARPCVDKSIIEEAIKKAALCNAAAPGIAITSTVKKAESGVISETVDRDCLYEIQTPQIFRSELIKAALINAKRKSIDITDDCMAVEILGAQVHIVEGSRRNIKITEKDDLELVKMFLNEEVSE